MLTILLCILFIPFIIIGLIIASPILMIVVAVIITVLNQLKYLLFTLSILAGLDLIFNNGHICNLITQYLQ